MARGSKKDKNGVPAATGENPEVAERKRLKNLALTKSMLSESAAKPLSLPLTPSKTVLKHHGRDILKKSQRKNRYLFSFPGLLSPISGGKIGELKDLGTKNPILYLDFPQGQVKLFGTIVYPKNRYLTLQFSRGGKNVMCEDYFDNMIIFSDAWWIGRKGENPDEARLEFPKEINGGQLEYDFKGGAGVAPVIKQKVEESSLNADLEDDFTDGENNLKDMEATPVRHSVRTARKTYNFAECSFRDDSVEDADELAEGEENKDTVANNHSPQQIQESSLEKSKNLFGSSMTKSGELSSNNHGSLVQASISTFFKKAEEKKEETTIRKPASPKVSSMKLQHASTKRKKDQVEGSRKKAKVIDERKAGTQIRLKEKKTENPSSVDSLKAYKRKTETSDSSNASASVEEDDIEVFSCTSEEDDNKDEDWAG